MPPGDDEFDRPPRPQEQDTSTGYDRDFARAEADRAAPGVPVSIAYWIARGAQALFGRLTRRR